jgi:hypothetical protein
MSAGVRRRRRRFRLVAVVGAAAAVVAIAAPASAGAPFDRHFTVIERDTAGHRIPDGFAFRFDVLNPANLSNKVGHGHARCTGQRGRKSRCLGLIHLDGAIGGFGDLVVRGNFGRRDRTLTVVDGNGDFTGRIAGKMTVHPLSRRYQALHFDLTR